MPKIQTLELDHMDITVRSHGCSGFVVSRWSRLFQVVLRSVRVRGFPRFLVGP